MRKKILGSIFVVAMAAIAGYNTYVNQTKVEMSDMALANVEALAEDEKVWGCYADVYECSFTVTSAAQIPILKKSFPMLVFEVGSTIDLSSLTTKYCKKDWLHIFEDECVCGEDIRCLEAIERLFS